MDRLLRELGRAAGVTASFIIVCCVVYPLVITGVTQAAFHSQANGSLVTDRSGNVVGSSLIGQCYYATRADSSGTVIAQTVTNAAGDDLYYKVDPRFFQGRPAWVWLAAKDANGNSLIDNHGNALQRLVQPPCEAAPAGTNANGSQGSNLGPSNPVLINAVTAYTGYLHSLGVARNADGSNAPMPVDLVTGDFTGFDPDISVAAALAQVDMVVQARGLTAARLRALVENHVEGRALGIFGSPRVNVLALNEDLVNGAAG